MRLVPVIAFLTLVTVGAPAASSRGSERPVSAPVALVASYAPPAEDHSGDPVRGRGWTYDSALTAAGLAAEGRLDRSGALLDTLQRIRREDGALESSYDLASGEGAGPLRAGNQAWVGLAALEWRAATCSPRHDALIAGIAAWLDRFRRPDGLISGGPDVTWASTEHNLEARAFYAGVAAAQAGEAVDRGTGRPCAPALEDVADPAPAIAGLDRAIAAHLFAGDHFRQGFRDDARPLDVQALGILWLLGQGRRADAEAVERFADGALRVTGRTVDWPGAEGQTFTGYRPYADAWGADVLWFEGTLMMRLAKARLGADVSEIDDTAARWTALSSPEMPLQVDRAGGEDYHVWPAAAPAAWLALSHSRIELL